MSDHHDILYKNIYSILIEKVVDLNMSDAKTYGHCVSQRSPTRSAHESYVRYWKPVRRTRTITYSTQQDTYKSKEKSKTISAILTDKPRSSIDILLGRVLLGQVQRRDDNPPSVIPNNTDKSKQKELVLGCID